MHLLTVGFEYPLLRNLRQYPIHTGRNGPRPHLNDYASSSTASSRASAIVQKYVPSAASVTNLFRPFHNASLTSNELIHLSLPGRLVDCLELTYRNLSLHTCAHTVKGVNACPPQGLRKRCQLY